MFHPTVGTQYAVDSILIENGDKNDSIQSFSHLVKILKRKTRVVAYFSLPDFMGAMIEHGTIELEPDGTVKFCINFDGRRILGPVKGRLFRGMQITVDRIE